MKTRTVAEYIDNCSSWIDSDKKKHVQEHVKKLWEQFWQMAGIKEGETITEVGDFDCMGSQEAEIKARKIAGWTEWLGEESTLIWKDGRLVAEVICCRGSWDMVLNGKKYYESLREPVWVEREVWLAEVNARAALSGLDKLS